MKQKFTNWFKSATRLGALAFVVFLGTSVSAQAPWCTPTVNDACGWVNGANTWVDCTIEEVDISSNGNSIYNKPADGCNTPIGTGSGYDLINPTGSIDISAGGSYQLSVTCGGGYQQKRLGVWIDLNRDNDFNDAGEFLNPTTANSTWNGLRTITIDIPCTGVVAGASRMRLRVRRFNQISAAQSCGGNWLRSEAEDYNITLSTPTTLAANFIVPAIVYTDNTYDFINTSQAAIFNSDWDKDADGTYDANTPDYSTSWSVPSTQQKCLKLRAENCLGVDSITQCFDVEVPVVVPGADFITNKTEINLFGEVELSDLSTFGPTGWQWEVFDSTPGDIKTLPFPVTTAGGTNANSKNPVFRFFEAGTYDVCLTATNGVGASMRRCKDDYITVLPLRDFTLGAGAQLTDEPVGRIYDHNGPGGDYGNNRSPNVDRFLINPCGATSIDFSFSQLKFGSAGDSLFIYAGENSAAPRIAAIGQNTPVPYDVNILGGAAYVTFESNGSGVDSGFIGTFRANVLANPPRPSVDFTLPAVSYVGVTNDLVDASTNALGIPTYTWDVEDPQGSTPVSYFGQSAEHTWGTSGIARICLTVDGCAGDSQTCKTIDIQVPNKQTELDFDADEKRPEISELVQLTTEADVANRFQWSVFPITATISDPSAKNPTVSFTKAGCYTFTLRAWNALDSATTVKTLVKDKFICAVNYCEPTVVLTSTDVAISNFKVSLNGTEVLNNASSTGVEGYNDFSATKFIEGTFGASYDFEIKRATTVDSATTKVWVDYNLDGVFNEPQELAASFPPSRNSTLTGSFKIPDISESFIGTGKIRVSMTYFNLSNEACGPIIAGEVEDYGIRLDNDMMPPTISLIGDDTVFVERVIAPNPPTYVDAGAIAMDATEGNLANIQTTTDFDQTTAGIYTYTYCITDASGNGPICVTRTVYVVLDRTAPELSVGGQDNDTITLEVFSAAVDRKSGVIANDAVDGDITSSIIVSGTVNTNVVGEYLVTYNVIDVQGNPASGTRLYRIVDTEIPVINPVGIEQIQINTIWADQTVVNDNYYNGINGTNTPLVATPQLNGLPNTTVRAQYPVLYTAVDGSGNAAVPVLRNYVVDDFIAPEINLKTLDTVIHRVNTPYFTTPAQVTDNFYSNNNVSLNQIDRGSVDEFTLGTYTETFVAVDGSGNTDTAIRFVKVVDDIRPTVFAPAINACAGNTFNNMSGLQLSDNYDAPADLLPNVRFTQNNVNIFEAGIYSMTYEVEDLSGNVSEPFSRPVFISYCLAGSVSVETVDLKKMTSIYPNPTSGNLTVNVAGVTNQDVTVTVYNTVGTQITSTTSDNGENIKVNLNGQAAGIYMVKVTTGGQTITKRVTLTK